MGAELAAVLGREAGEADPEHDIATRRGQKTDGLSGTTSGPASGSGARGGSSPASRSP
jgi:hypothetical protein